MAWLKELFRWKNRQSPSDFSERAPLETVCVIGDIHGRSDLLKGLISKLDPAAIWVFLGDYIDRGPDSRQVLEILRELQRARPEQVICLMGNHEKMLLDFLDQRSKRSGRWLKNGGIETLESFGFDGVDPDFHTQYSPGIRSKLAAILSDGTEQWLRKLPTMWLSGNICAVHAALDPELGVDEQPEGTLLWGNSGFSRRIRNDGIWVVHGHTVVERPFVGLGRISIDTGAYYTGRLTAVQVDPTGAIKFIMSKG